VFKRIPKLRLLLSYETVSSRSTAPSAHALHSRTLVSKQIEVTVPHATVCAHRRYLLKCFTSQWNCRRLQKLKFLQGVNILYQFCSLVSPFDDVFGLLFRWTLNNNIHQISITRFSCTTCLLRPSTTRRRAVFHVPAYFAFRSGAVLC